MCIAYGACIACGFFIHLGSRFSGMEAIGQSAIVNKIGFLRWSAFAVVFIVPCFANQRAVVYNGKLIDPETFAYNHNFPHLCVFINKIGLAEMSECLVDEDTTKFGVDNDGIFAPRYGFCREQVDGAFGYFFTFLLLILDIVKASQITHGMISLLHIHAVSSHCQERNAAKNSFLHNKTSIRVGEI